MFNKRVLLIGGSGQVGQYIQKYAPDYGFKVWAPPKNEVDVLDANKLEKAISRWQPSIFINTSASHVLPLCDKSPEEAFLLNSIAVYRMAELSKKNGLRFVTFSTNYVFDGTLGRPIRENDPLSPLQIYGISKSAGEFAALAKYPENSFIIRASTIYGGVGGSRVKGGNFVLDIIKEVEGKKLIEVGGDQITNPTYAGDLAKATLALLSLANVQSGIYHLVSDNYCSYYDFTKEIFKLAGINAEAVKVTRGGFSGGARRPIFAVLENIRARAYGITLPNWEVGLASYIEYLKSRKLLGK